LQARASGTNHGLSPVINVATDPVSEPAFLMVCTL
jgi:hypothetical protein